MEFKFFTIDTRMIRVKSAEMMEAIGANNVADVKEIG